MDPCSAISAAVPQGTLVTVRSKENDIMAFRRGPALTTYMVDFIPPRLMPSYNGGLPGVSTCFANTYGGASKKYLQNERNDILGNRVRRKFLYGRLPCDYSPFPDVASAKKVMSWKKLADGGHLIPSNVDSCRREELQKFHERCVNYRDYYLDKTDSFGGDEFFDVGRPYPVRCPVDERAFKIKRSVDRCDLPGFLGPPLRCGAMPCLRKTGMLAPFVVPKLPRSPFVCDAIKPKDPNEMEVLIV